MSIAFTWKRADAPVPSFIAPARAMRLPSALNETPNDRMPSSGASATVASHVAVSIAREAPAFAGHIPRRSRLKPSSLSVRRSFSTNAIFMRPAVIAGFVAIHTPLSSRLTGPSGSADHSCQHIGPGCSERPCVRWRVNTAPEAFGPGGVPV